jgi:uncharacterized protein YacL
LLTLYTATTFYIISIVLCDVNATCKATDTRTVTEGMAYVVTTVGGLVSALVVAQLAATQPGENPTTLFLSESAPDIAKSIATAVVIGYLAIWVITGMAALVIGVMLHPEASPTLKDMGTTWLGLAVAAAYAYFEIRPQGKEPGT